MSAFSDQAATVRKLPHSQAAALHASASGLVCAPSFLGMSYCQPPAELYDFQIRNQGFPLGLLLPLTATQAGFG